MVKKMKDVLKEQISERFEGDRISCLLYFGTRAFGVHGDDNSDYDFILILKDYDEDDSLKLKDMMDDEVFDGKDMNVNFLYLSDMRARGRENFQIRSVGPTLYHHMASAEVLIGDNVFKRSPLRLSKSRIADELSFKIQEYNGRCDKLFLTRVEESDLAAQLLKYTKDMVRFLLIKAGHITLDDLTKMSFADMVGLIEDGKIFAEETRNKVSALLGPEHKVADIDKTRRLMYEEYLSTLSAEG